MTVKMGAQGVYVFPDGTERPSQVVELLGGDLAAVVVTVLAEDDGRVEVAESAANSVIGSAGYLTTTPRLVQRLALLVPWEERFSTELPEGVQGRWAQEDAVVIGESDGRIR